MQEIIQYIKEPLSGLYPLHEIKAMARVIATDVFHFSLLDYYGGKDRKLSKEQRDLLHKIAARLANHEPLQYVIGEAWFHGRMFKVNRDVLIPRPETGELVDCILRENPQTGLKVLDIGTGSGCIAVSLAVDLPSPQVEAWDISPKALAVARENAERHHARITFKQTDILERVPLPDAQWDIIVSNPPYVTEKEKSTMEANVLQWEPGIALFVPDEAPLRFYEAIAKFGQKHLKDGGKLYFEINQLYGKETTQLLQHVGYSAINLIQDSCGNDRIITATR